MTTPMTSPAANQPTAANSTTGSGLSKAERDYWDVVLRARIMEVEALKRLLGKT
jgi:hypothetical protein